jgi:DNA replication protein DnaC
MSDSTVKRNCDEHGEYEAHKFTIPGKSEPRFTNCPGCADQAMQKTRELERARAQQQRRSDQLKTNRGRSGIPPRNEDADLTSFDATTPVQRRVKAICKAYADTWPVQYQKGQSLIFTGPCGTGKTHAACAIGNSVMAEHLSSVRYGTMSHLLRCVKDSYRKNSDESENQALRGMLAPELLIIDEVGATRATEHDLGLLFEIIDGRYSHKLPTILISNLSAVELEGFLGERAMDRFRECGSILAFDWESYRGKNEAT